MKEGFLFIATGEKYISEAKLSAKSIRKHHEFANIAIITNNTIVDNEFDEVIIIDNHDSASWKDGLNFKVAGLLKSPFDKTIFIDTDTYFTDNTSELFRLLDFFDLLMCQAPNDVSRIRNDDERLKGLIPYNTGVMVFNSNKKVRDFFMYWSQLYTTNPSRYPGDQAAFMEAFIKHDVKIYVLAYIYNFRLHSFITVPPLKVKILHGRSANYERLNTIINKHLAHRTWSPYWGMVFKNHRRFFKIKQQLRKLLGRKKFNSLKNSIRSLKK